ncbi:Cupin domain protein [Bradyrhizobium erythrophlei]|jgi:quercetin dioxygenase-like cupin family protein|nr:Cupin domain protein [Bradyrhizobium erythrophlei]
MLTRRGFTTCALCAVAGFAATAAEAQSAATPIKRTILQRTDGPAPGYETLVVSVEIEPNAVVARHTHPGVEAGYVVEGEAELTIDGQPTRTLNAGQTFEMPSRVPHWQKTGDKGLRAVAVYVVEKGKPLASPA